MYRIHVVGCAPRTGTTLMAELLFNCFKVDLYTGIENRLSYLPRRDGNVFLTKSPKDIIITKDILECFKKLFVIYLVRDPRDIIVSKHREDPDNYWSSLMYWKLYTPFGEEIKNHPRFMTIRYEDLVSNPDVVQQQIHNRLNFLKKRAPFSDFHKLAKPSKNFIDSLSGLRPISTDSVGNWKRHKSRVVAQLLEYGSISEDLIKYNYETDRTWESELMGIEPSTDDSHYSVFATKKFVQGKQRLNKLRAFRTTLGHKKWVIRLRSLAAPSLVEDQEYILPNWMVTKRDKILLID